MDEKDPWVLLSRPAEWDDAMVEQGFGPRACERRARKTNYILLGAAVLAGLVFCVFGGGLNGGAAALTAVLCLGRRFCIPAAAADCRCLGCGDPRLGGYRGTGRCGYRSG